MNSRRIQSVGALLVNPQGKILLQQRDNKPGLLFPGHWTTLGGKVERGETPDEAMRRELYEETELRVPLRLWKTYEHRHMLNGVEIITEQYLYAGTIDRPANEIPLHEGQALGYFGPDDLDTLPVAFGFAGVFREFFAQQPDA